MTQARWLDGILLLLLLLLAGWVQGQFGQLQGRSQEAFIASNYIFMALTALILAIAAARGYSFLRFIGTSTGEPFVRNIAMGALVGFIMTASGKLFLSKLLKAGAVDPTLGFTFVILLAVGVETYFFVGGIYPTFKQFLSSTRSPLVATILAAVITAGIAAVWHTVAAQGSEAAIASFFMVFLVFIGLAEYTKAIEAPIAAHFVLNLITGG